MESGENRELGADASPVGRGSAGRQALLITVANDVPRHRLSVDLPAASEARLDVRKRSGEGALVRIHDEGAQIGLIDF